MDEILASRSGTLVPAQVGQGPVTLNNRDVDGDAPPQVALGKQNVTAIEALLKAGVDV